MLCFRCGEPDADGPFEHGKYRYRCSDERTCSTRADKNKLVAGWKGSSEEREGRVLMRSRTLVVEEMGGQVAVEFQVRCLECDRRGSFFVQRLWWDSPSPMIQRRVAQGLELYIIEKIDYLRGMGCSHTNPGGSIGDLIAKAVSA